MTEESEHEMSLKMLEKKNAVARRVIAEASRLLAKHNYSTEYCAADAVGNPISYDSPSVASISGCGALHLAELRLKVHELKTPGVMAHALREVNARAPGGSLPRFCEQSTATQMIELFRKTIKELEPKPAAEPVQKPRVSSRYGTSPYDFPRRMQRTKGAAEE